MFSCLLNVHVLTALISSRRITSERPFHIEETVRLKERLAVSVLRLVTSSKHLPHDRSDLVATFIVDKRCEVRRLAGLKDFKSHHSYLKFDYLFHRK